MSGPRDRKDRFASLRGLVREEDLSKLDAMDAHLDDVREKHHPGALFRSDDPDMPFYFETDDEEEEP